MAQLTIARENRTRLVLLVVRLSLLKLWEMAGWKRRQELPGSIWARPDDFQCLHCQRPKLTQGLGHLLVMLRQEGVIAAPQQIPSVGYRDMSTLSDTDSRVPQ